MRQCPLGYIGDDLSGLCVYRGIELDKGPDSAYNCTSHQYFNLYNSTCQECDPTCETCYGSYATDCYTCPRGRYIATTQGVSLDRYCLTCDQVAMYYGPSGACMEYCGDALNFGLNACDDGNLEDGDGCSATCELEAGWTCSGGTIKKKDTCNPLRTRISKVQMTEWNQLIIIFTRDVMIMGELASQDLQLYAFATPLKRSHL